MLSYLIEDIIACALRHGSQEYGEPRRWHGQTGNTADKDSLASNE